MKFLSLIFSLLFLISCSSNDPEKTNFEPLPATSITKGNDGQYVGDTHYEYDNNKLITLTISNAEMGNTGYGELTYTDDLLTRINRYNSENELTEYVEVNYDANNSLENYITYKVGQDIALKNVVLYNSDNTINIKSYSGDFENQAELYGETIYTLDSGNNITKVQTANYQITYEYDSKNGVFKNVVARDVLNLMGRLHGLLDRGGMNNAVSYEFSNDQITDHIDLINTYNENSYPELVEQVSPEFGPVRNVEYSYK